MIKYDGRIEWHDVFTMLTKIYGLRSSCVHYKVGVVAARGDLILTAGYNGPPPKEPHCHEVGCAKCDERGNKLPAGSGLCRGSHAEMNCLANANIEPAVLQGSTIYSTYSPCHDCAKHLVRFSLRGFVYQKDYDEEEGRRAKEVLARHGVEVRQFDLSLWAIKLIIKRLLEDLSPEEAMKLLKNLMQEVKI